MCEKLWSNTTQEQQQEGDCGLCTYFSLREGTKPLVGQRREVSNSKREMQGVSWEEKGAPLGEAVHFPGSLEVAS